MKDRSRDRDKGPEMMDPSAPEGDAVVHTNRERNVYALDTLVKEVVALFSETTYEVSNRTRFNAALDVQFDTHESSGLSVLLSLVEDDERVAEVVVDVDDVLVRFRGNPRLQDSREPFGLAEAWSVMNESAGVLYIPESLSFPEGAFDGPGAPEIIQGDWPKDMSFGNPQEDGLSAGLSAQIPPSEYEGLDLTAEDGSS